jgi:hypothetical protein
MIKVIVLTWTPVQEEIAADGQHENHGQADDDNNAGVHG